MKHLALFGFLILGFSAQAQLVPKFPKMKGIEVARHYQSRAVELRGLSPQYVLKSDYSYYPVTSKPRLGGGWFGVLACHSSLLDRSRKAADVAALRSNEHCLIIASKAEVVKEQSSQQIRLLEAAAAHSALDENGKLEIKIPVDVETRGIDPLPSAEH